jgi:hypothetical protein
VSRVVARDVLIEALAGADAEKNPTDIITGALEIAAHEAKAIYDLGEGVSDTRSMVAYGLAARLQALRSYVASIDDWDREHADATPEGSVAR